MGEGTATDEDGGVSRRNTLPPPQLHLQTDRLLRHGRNSLSKTYNMQLRYEDYLYSLLPEIVNRREIKRPFN